MDANSTQFLLLKHIYGEIGPDERSYLEKELASNWNLLEEYRELLSLKSRLQKFKAQPSDACIDFVLDYGKKEDQLIAAIA